jgi:hypothetical protein
MSNTPSLAPGEFRYDTTVYIVLNGFGKLGSAYVETDEAEADESTVVSHIITGVYSNPLRVIAFNTHEGWSRDVTEDIAHKILDLNQQGTALSAAAREFVVRVTGKSVTVAV